MQYGSVTPGVPHPSEVELAALGQTAQRKAGLQLIPVIGVGYGLASMDRINISFASLQMNREPHFSRIGLWVWLGAFFIG